MRNSLPSNCSIHCPLKPFYGCGNRALAGFFYRRLAGVLQRIHVVNFSGVDRSSFKLKDFLKQKEADGKKREFSSMRNHKVNIILKVLILSSVNCAARHVDNIHARAREQQGSDSSDSNHGNQQQTSPALCSLIVIFGVASSSPSPQGIVCAWFVHGHALFIILVSLRVVSTARATLTLSTQQKQSNHGSLLENGVRHSVGN